MHPSLHRAWGRFTTPGGEDARVYYTNPNEKPTFHVIESVTVLPCLKKRRIEEATDPNTSGGRPSPHASLVVCCPVLCRLRPQTQTYNTSFDHQGNHVIKTPENYHQPTAYLIQAVLAVITLYLSSWLRDSYGGGYCWCVDRRPNQMCVCTTWGRLIERRHAM